GGRLKMVVFGSPVPWSSGGITGSLFPPTGIGEHSAPSAFPTAPLPSETVISVAMFWHHVCRFSSVNNPGHPYSVPVLGFGVIVTVGNGVEPGILGSSGHRAPRKGGRAAPGAACCAGRSAGGS